jgi:hypothetical protein
VKREAGDYGLCACGLRRGPQIGKSDWGIVGQVTKENEGGGLVGSGVCD